MLAFAGGGVEAGSGPLYALSSGGASGLRPQASGLARGRRSGARRHPVLQHAGEARARAARGEAPALVGLAVGEQPVPHLVKGGGRSRLRVRLGRQWKQGESERIGAGARA